MIPFLLLHAYIYMSLHMIHDKDTGIPDDIPLFHIVSITDKYRYNET